MRSSTRPDVFNTSLVLITPLISLLLILMSTTLAHAQSDQDEMLTSWGAKLDPSAVWQEYPRPQMVRENWTNLNGPWDYTVMARGEPGRTVSAGKILVPFAIESVLSGVGHLLQPDEVLWYERDVELAAAPAGRLLLHFEAVDYESTLWVNGEEVGTHTGGNLPFTFDITEKVIAGRNTLRLQVRDATDGFQLRGKQSLQPKGIWYTRVSGIWQTVWMEEVPATYLQSLRLNTTIADGSIRVTPVVGGAVGAAASLRLRVLDEGKQLAEATAPLAAHAVTARVSKAVLWTPENPKLYDLEVALLDAEGTVLDEVGSYAGIRELSKQKDAAGNWRFQLNGEFIFHWGPLDQGWWPDGLLTPPSEEAMRFDVDYLKASGFNMIRKHIKVEPRAFYTHCDRVGMLVWQDQVSGGVDGKSWPEWTRLRDAEPKGPLDAEWPDAAHAQYMRELKGMIDHLYNHPSIAVWVPFNERWGQHRSMEVGRWVADYDPSRLLNIASGGNFFPIGDIADEHKYPHPIFAVDREGYFGYIRVVGEFGGHGYPVEGHLWDVNARNWGYGGLPKDKTEWMERFELSLEKLSALKDQGIGAGVYTQTTDVEGEINGLLTYDRKVQKVSPEVLAELSSRLLQSD